MTYFTKLLQNYKVQFFVVCLIGLFSLKLVAAGHTNVTYFILNEILLFFVIYFAAINGAVLFNKQQLSPIPMVVGVAIAGLINLLSLQNGDNFFHLFSLFTPEKSNQTVVLIINAIYTLILVLPILYIFLSLRSLFFLKQKKNLRTYYNSFLVFLILSSLTAFLKLPEYNNFSFVHYAFVVNAYILVVINALRISWITFLPKKRKLHLLGLAVGLIVIFSMVLNGLSSEVPKSFLKHFSPGVINFMTVISVYGLLYFIFLFFITLFHLPTAEAIDRKTREVSSLQDLSRLINQVFDPKELMLTVTNLASQMLSADASWIILNNKDGQSIASPGNIETSDAETISKNIIASLPREFSGVRFVVAPQSVKREKAEARYASAAVAAIKSHAFNAGLLISIRKTEVPFDEEDRKTLEAFADNVAIAFENSRLLQESIEKERLEKELDVAREMQRKLIPETLPAFSQLQISAAFIPAFEVGGDYYDFFPMGDQKTAFIIADVSGKGISAAFIMAEIRGIFEIVSRQHSRPKEVLCTVNAALQRMLDRRHFITGVYGIIDEANGSVTFSRAGHTPILLVRKETVQPIQPKGIGLGISYTPLFDESLEEYAIQLEPNDVLVFYTDGITESKNGNNEDFGQAKLMEIVHAYRHEPPEVMQNKILESLTVFSQNMQQHDDITLLIFKWVTNNLESSDGRISDSNAL